MRVLPRLRHLPIGFNMTPMIDVVFLLIIFFLLSNHLAQREHRIAVELPDAISGQPALADNAPRMTVTVTADGELWLAADPVSAEQLSGLLRSEQQRQQGLLELRIRCDRHVEYQLVEPLLSQAVKVGISKVSFAVVADGRSTATAGESSRAHSH